MTLSKSNSVNLQATLSQYSLVGGYREPAKVSAGKYICMECGDATITFHTPQEEYKTKCPKCNSLMTLAKKPLSTYGIASWLIHRGTKNMTPEEKKRMKTSLQRAVKSGEITPEKAKKGLAAINK